MPAASESIEDRLGPAASAALHRELALPARRALVEADDPLATLTRLFALGDPVDHDLVEGQPAGADTATSACSSTVSDTARLPSSCTER